MRLPKWLWLSLAVAGAMGDCGERSPKFRRSGLTPPFPPTLGYVVWSLTMIPVCVLALRKINWKLSRSGRSIFYGCAVGFSGAAGQLILFRVLEQGPAYLIFPIVCLSPAVTIVLSWMLLRERTYWRLPALCFLCPRFFSSHCRNRPTVQCMEACGWFGPSPFFSCGDCRPTL